MVTSGSEGDESGYTTAMAEPVSLGPVTSGQNCHLSITKLNSVQPERMRSESLPYYSHMPDV